MVPLWGRAHRVEYANLVARDMRDTLYSMVPTQVNKPSCPVNYLAVITCEGHHSAEQVNGPGGLSVTDHIVRDIVSTHTRAGIALTPAPTATHHLSLLISMSNITLSNVTGAALSIQTGACVSLSLCLSEMSAHGCAIPF